VGSVFLSNTAYCYARKYIEINNAQCYSVAKGYHKSVPSKYDGAVAQCNLVSARNEGLRINYTVRNRSGRLRGSGKEMVTWNWKVS